MLQRLFPKQFDNRFPGHVVAIGLFGVVILMELAMGANSLTNTRTVASLADAIPLDRYTNGGAEAVVALFALAGGLLVLIRYRAMIPFMFLVLLVLHLGSKAVLLVHPIAKSGV